MVEPRHLDQLLHPMFEDEAVYRKAGSVLTRGLAASPGASQFSVFFMWTWWRELCCCRAQRPVCAVRNCYDVGGGCLMCSTACAL